MLRRWNARLQCAVRCMGIAAIHPACAWRAPCHCARHALTRCHMRRALRIRPSARAEWARVQREVHGRPCALDARLLHALASAPAMSRALRAVMRALAGDASLAPGGQADGLGGRMA